MRYLAVAALLAAIPAFGQQPDPASGVLVPVAPPAFHLAIRNMLGTAPVPQAAPQQPAPKRVRLVEDPPAGACAIPLLRVPARDHLDDAALLKDADPALDPRILRSPPAPECR